ncbi:MAG: Ig-like domain-containing protein [Acidobacteriota bacterium]
MKRHVMIASLFGTLSLAAAVFAAAPFGAVQGKAGGGNGGGGLIPIIGWALDDNGVGRVDFTVDGHVIGSAAYGQGRPQVTKKFPGYADSNAPGWVYWLDTTQFLNGNHLVGAIVRSKLAGESRTLKAIKLQFTNTTQALVPFGRIETPNAQAELFGYCNSATPRYSIIQGWALDSGIEINNEGVGYVELLIDHSFYSNSLSDCRRIPGIGNVDCYGQRREDISLVFPSLIDSIHSGFRFMIDAGALMRAGWYGPGDHWLTIRAGDVASQRSQLDEIKVTFTCAEDIPNEGSIGLIESPLPGYTYSNSIQVNGWALDFEGVASVKILVDGVPQGTATYGLSRLDVATAHPGYTNNPNGGWTFTLDTKPIANGQHKLQAEVTDIHGEVVLLGEYQIYIGNL